MPLDHSSADLIADLHALIAASAKLDRIAAQRGLTTRDLHKARTAARRELFSAAHMSPEYLSRAIDSRLPALPAHVQRARIAKAATTPPEPTRWTDGLAAARARLRESIGHVLARIEGKTRPTT